MVQYHCVTCDKNMEKKSKYSHLKTKNHLSKEDKLSELRKKVASRISEYNGSKFDSKKLDGLSSNVLERMLEGIQERFHKKDLKDFMKIDLDTSHTEWEKTIQNQKKILARVVRPIKLGYTVEQTQNFDNIAGTYNIKMDRNTIDYVNALEDLKEPLKQLFTKLNKQGGIKVNGTLQAIVQKVSSNYIKETREDAYFYSNEKGKTLTISNKGEITRAINEIINTIKAGIENYTTKGSGWVFHAPVRFYINVSNFMQHSGREYKPFPEWFTSKKCGNNIRNLNEFCLDYCVANFFLNIHRSNNPNAPERYQKWVDENIKRDGIKYPVSLYQIEKYCQVNNHLNISIDVWKIGKKDLEWSCVHICKELKQNHMFIALYDNHYVRIKDFSRFRAGETKNTQKKFICSKCMKISANKDLIDKHTSTCTGNRESQPDLTNEDGIICSGCGFTYASMDLLKQHKLDCNLFKPARIKMPFVDMPAPFKNADGTPGKISNNYLRFTETDQAKSQMKPYVCYADFEALLKAYQKSVKIMRNGVMVEEFKTYHKHVLISFNIICIETLTGKIVQNILYLGDVERGYYL